MGCARKHRPNTRLPRGAPTAARRERRRVSAVHCTPELRAEARSLARLALLGFSARRPSTSPPLPPRPPALLTLAVSHGHMTTTITVHPDTTTRTVCDLAAAALGLPEQLYALTASDGSGLRPWVTAAGIPSARCTVIPRDACGGCRPLPPSPADHPHRPRRRRCAVAPVFVLWVIWLASGYWAGRIVPRCHPEPIGEASNPGPDPCARHGHPHPTRRIASINATRLSSNWELILAQPWDILLVAEARTTPGDATVARIRRDRCCYFAGAPSPEGVSLVGVVVRAGCAEVTHRSPCGRSIDVLWRPGNSAPTHLTCIYGDVASTVAATMHTSSLARDALQRATLRGPLPALIAGDFNRALDDLPCAPTYQASGWEDLESGTTCATSNARQARRIDLLLANCTLRRLAGTCRVDYTTGIPTHAWQAIDVPRGPPQWVLGWHSPEPYMVPSSTSPSPCDAWRSAAEPYRAAFADACSRRMVDDCWAALEPMLTQYFGLRSGEATPCQRAPGEARWRRVTPPCTPEGDAVPTATLRTLRRLNRLKALRQAWMGQDPHRHHRAAHIVAALHRAEPGNTPWRAHICHLATPAQLEALILEAQREYDHALSAARAARSESWYRWCNECLATCSGPVYRWIRNGPREHNPYPATVGQGETPGPQALIERLDAYWWGLWASPQPTECDMLRWTRHLARLSPYPAHTPLDVARLRRVLKRWAKRKAAGSDGWKPDELKDLPDEALEALCAFFAVVEATGCWPSKLSSNLVAMLTKNGTADPGDRRPIVLLSAIYRLWAAARAAEMRGWLVANHALQTGPAASAAAQAADLALILQQARTAGWQVDGLAVDWSKCYDRLPLSVLRAVADAAGIPPGIATPMLAAYSFPRRLIADGLAGELYSPTCGLTPGCPAATHWLALLMFCWAQELKAHEPDIIHREYVDDLTAHRQHNNPDDAVTRVVRLIQITESLARDTRLQLNVDKSRCFSTHAPTRAALTGSSIQAAAHFIDLGVDQHVGSRPCNAKRRKRTEEMAQRCSRIYLVPAPLHWRGNLTQASATSLGCYAPEANPIPMGLLRQMRHDAFVAAWRHTFRCAPEVAFTMFLHWRADPLAIAAVSPLLYLRGALERGVITRDALMHTWDYCVDKYVGPIPAARQAFRIANLRGTISGCTNRFGEALNLLTATPVKAKAFILEAFRDAEMQRLAARREPFSPLHDGVDTWASTLFMRAKGWKEPARATLRTVMAGGAIPQAVAAKWAPVGATCPFCKQGPEDNYHRYWLCPRWDRVRLRVLPDTPLSLITRSLPRITLTHGILPLDPELHRLRRAAEKAGQMPPVQQLSHPIWTDGSACHPKDMLLRRAAWAACWWEPDGSLHYCQAQTQGAQTVGRAELSAACWAYRCNPRVPALYVDNRYVVDGINAVIQGQAARLLEGPDADLWYMLCDARPHTPPTWTPAHKSAAWYSERGLPHVQWLGNRQADHLAREAALAIAPAHAVAAARARTLSSLAAAQRVIAAVQGAVLDQKRATPSGFSARAKRQRTVRSRLLRRLRPSRKGPAPARGPALPLDTSASWPGVHVMVPARGPLGEPSTVPVLRGSVAWPATCAACRTTAACTAAWTRMACTPCPATLPAGHTLQRRPHALVRDGNAWRCVRCSLAVRSAHRARMTGRRCPVPAVLDGTGVELPGAQPAARAAALAARAWLHSQLGRSAPGLGLDQAPSVVVPDPPPAPMALRWDPHRIASSGRLALCLRCGQGNTARMPQRLAATPCPGYSLHAARVTQALRAGAFDAFLASAPPATIDAARARGWSPIAHGE